jgi:hypothetical protein
MTAWRGGVSDPAWKTELGEGPLVAVALHHGHQVRDEVIRHLALDEVTRLREEDPLTGEWTAVAPHRIVVNRSRFEMDLNRPRDKAVYRRPEDAWGLEVWKPGTPDKLFERSLAQYDAFYAEMRELFDALVRTHGRFLVLDIHSYNHRRGGSDGPLADPAGNPQVNVGTGTMDRARWAPVVDRFIAELSSADFPGDSLEGPLDVRENVRFFGGNFPRWIHEQYPETGCALALEFKKIFMDEWTGQADRRLMGAIHVALRQAAERTLETFLSR